MYAFPLTDTTQVIVWAYTALVASSHNRPIATITDHIGVHHAAGCLLSTWRTVVSPALLLLWREKREREQLGKAPQKASPSIVTIGLSKSASSSPAL